jgi:hypothetical protein
VFSEDFSKHALRSAFEQEYSLIPEPAFYDVFGVV